VTDELSAELNAWLESGDGGAPSDIPLDVPAIRAAAPPSAAPMPGSLLDAISALPAAADQLPAPAASASAPVRTAARYVLFSVAGAHYAVPQPHVTELDRVPAFTFVPNVPPWVRGITNRRGDILSVVDARTLLGIERLAAGNGRMLVVRLLDDSCSLGLLVDEVHQIVTVPPGDVRAPGPGLDGPLAPFLAGLVELDQRTVAVLDLDRFLRSPLVRQFDEPADTAAQGLH
jgi:purine-binding chemotaxis protein CheW